MSYTIWLEIDAGGPEPSTLQSDYWNYTSNCSRMWRHAIPETDGLAGLHGMKAGYVLSTLRRGIRKMESSPDMYREMNPKNGWGDFDSQLESLKQLVRMFEDAPLATVYVSR